MVSMTDHKCGISISLIFDMLFQYLLIFSYGIAVLGTPPPTNVPLLIHRHSSTEVRIPTDKSLAAIIIILYLINSGAWITASTIFSLIITLSCSGIT